MKEITRLWIVVLIAAILITAIVFAVTSPINKTKVAKLVIYGDNIQTDYKAIVKNDKVYLSYDTIKKVIDEHIFYDKLSSKVIITTHDYLIKYKMEDKKYSSNLEQKETINVPFLEKDMPYLCIEDLASTYNITISYNKELDSVIIDNGSATIGISQKNKIDVYANIETDSTVLAKLNKEDQVIVYTESLKHNRWYKVKTKDNIIGYVFKEVLTLQEKVPEEKPEKEEKETIVMYWQYGNGLDTLTKEAGVNVVSPTLYELKNSKGEITSKSAKDYVNKAKSLGYKVWPIITNGIDNTSYTPQDTSLLMNSEYARETLIANIEQLLINDNIDGINIDFENMKEADREIFTQFLRELAPVVRKHGKVLSVDVYFVKYIDRKGAGEAVDYVMLMGYDQRGSWSTEMGSIAEVSWTEKNVKSMMEDSKIPPEKIILGIPFYTRLWTQKTGDTNLKTTVYTINEMKAYIANNGLTAKYDEASGQNFVEHKKGSYTYKMWLEDATSVKNRVGVVNNNSLAGIAAWRRGFETSDIWKTIDENIKK